MTTSYRVQLHWLSADQGGRKIPIRGERYTPTARFAGENDQFSVVLEYPQPAERNSQKASLRLLNPRLVEISERIHDGIALEIMEGLRVVAHCVVDSSEIDPVAATMRSASEAERR